VTVYNKTLSSQYKLIIELDNRTVEISSLIDLFNLKYFEWLLIYLILVHN
jgi:hypothetical protein